MKERPILFSGEMVRAILDGRKTQTRRIMVPQPPVGYEFDERVGEYFHWRNPITDQKAQCDQLGRLPGMFTVKCKYGKPGDRLWVRESWKYHSFDADGCPFIRYKADDKTQWSIPTEEWADRVVAIWDDNFKKYNCASDLRWRTPRFMPRWASRLTLEITGIRVERIQAITVDDIVAEGVDVNTSHKTPTGLVDMPDGTIRLSTAQCCFSSLWDSINGKKEGCSWDANPWVWVIEFRQVTA